VAAFASNCTTKNYYYFFLSWIPTTNSKIVGLPTRKENNIYILFFFP